jgi:hypothetical protein
MGVVGADQFSVLKMLESTYISLGGVGGGARQRPQKLLGLELMPCDDIGHSPALSAVSFCERPEERQSPDSRTIGAQAVQMPGLRPSARTIERKQRS